MMYMQLKKDLAEVVLGAVTQYLNSMRGAAALGPNSRVIIVPGTNIVQIEVHTPAGPDFFEITIRKTFN